MVPRLAGRCRKQLLKPLPPARLENFQRWAGPILKDRACQSGAEDMIMTDWASLLGRKVTVTRSARPSCDSGKSPPFSVSHYLTRSPSPCLSLSDCSRQKTKAMPTCQLQVDWNLPVFPVRALLQVLFPPKNVLRMIPACDLSPSHHLSLLYVQENVLYILNLVI